MNDMNILKKILIVIIALVVFIGVAGFLILPAVLKPVLIKKISETSKRETSIVQIKINPFALSVTVKGFKLTDPGQKTPFVAFDELYVNVDVLTSIFRRALILEEIRLQKPYIGVTRNENGSYNFSDLLPNTETKKEEATKPFLFSLNNIQIVYGDLTELADRRSQAVREELIEKGKVEPARIFLVKASSLAPEKKEKVKDSRVGFKIK